MRELITVQAFERGLAIAVLAWIALCVVAGLIGRLRGRRGALLRGGGWALVAPIAWALWRFYAWMVRVEPDTGYVGLHRVSVFAVCLLVFAAVGALAGTALARLYRGTDRGGDEAAS